MSLAFDADYYSGTGYGSDYGELPRFSHFIDRAAWLISRYAENSFTSEIWVIGAGWGHVVKAARDLLPQGQKSRVKGIVFSQFEKDQTINVVGLPDGAIELIDAENKVFPTMDIAVSWNFFDSLPPLATAKHQGIANRLMNKATWQTHIICMDSNDPNAQRYKDQGYNIQTRAYWRGVFDAVDVSAGQHCVLVNYNTGNNSRKTVGGWTNATGLNIPTSWGRVSL